MTNYEQCIEDTAYGYQLSHIYYNYLSYKVTSVHLLTTATYVIKLTYTST